MLYSDADLLKHIQEETAFILNNTAENHLENILEDEILSRAIIRSFEIIGEATKKISVEFKTAHQEIEWKKMAATRDKLIHDYFGIDYEIGWVIIQNKLPQLYKEISKILNSEKN